MVVVVEEERREADAGREEGAEVVEDRRDEEVTVRGTGARVSPIEGAVAAWVEAAGVAGLDAGLSHDEKKSSSVAAAFAGDASGVSSRPSM